MKLYILDNFIKTIPNELRAAVIKKTGYFYEQLLKNKGIFNKLPAGFWVRKINGREDILKFRINNGDRIIFTTTNLAGINREHENDGIILIEYTTHDKQESRIRNITPNMENAEELSIDTEFTDDNENTQEEKNVKKINVNSYIDNGIMYEVVKSDTELSALAEEGSKYYLYFLNHEQFSATKLPMPLLLSGSAGSGKTLVGIRKLYQSSLIENQKIAYFTYTENLREHAREIFEFIRGNSIETPKSKVDFFSINNYSMNVLNLKENNVITFDKFNYWFNSNKVGFPKEIREIGAINIWTEIRGIIKGFMGIDWYRELNSPIIDKDDYLELSDKYSIYSQEERELLYTFTAKEYTRWQENLILQDENDMAVELINKADEDTIGKYDMIVCDEVQDLSEAQIYMLHKLTNETGNIFLSGDIHQIINPTYFSFSRIANMFYVNEIKYNEAKLEKNYRSTDSIVKFTNKFSDIRREKIGKFGEKEEYKEKSVRTGGSVFLLNGNNSAKQKITKFINERAYAVLVVSDTKQQEELKKILGNDDNGRIFTVHEIKGLEYTHVILCNFASGNIDSWTEIISGKGRKSTKLRYYFNLLYVAATRARKNIVIFEERDANFLYSQCSGLYSEIKEFNPDILELNKVSTLDDWRREAEKLEKEEKYDHAAKSYKKAKDEKGVKRCEAKILEQTGKYIEAGNLFYEAGELIMAAEMFKLGGVFTNTSKNLKDLKLYYLCMEDYEKAGDICFMTAEDDEAMKFYNKEFEKLTIRFDSANTDENDEKCFNRLDIKTKACKNLYKEAVNSAEAENDNESILMILERLEKNGRQNAIEKYEEVKCRTLAKKYLAEEDYYRLGIILSETGRSLEAVEAFKTALQKETDSIKIREIEISIAEASGDYETAGNILFEAGYFERALKVYSKLDKYRNKECVEKNKLIARAEMLAKNGRHEDAADLMFDVKYYDEAYRFFKTLEEKSPWKIKKIGTKFRDAKMSYLLFNSKFEEAGDMLMEERNYTEAMTEFNKIPKKEYSGEKLQILSAKKSFCTEDYETAGDIHYFDLKDTEKGLKYYQNGIYEIDKERKNTRGKEKGKFAKMASSMKAKVNMGKQSYLKAAGSFERLGNIELAKECYSKINLRKYPVMKRREIEARIKNLEGDKISAADSYFAMGNLKKALDIYESEIGSFDKTTKEFRVLHTKIEFCHGKYLTAIEKLIGEEEIEFVFAAIENIPHSYHREYSKESNGKYLFEKLEEYRKKARILELEKKGSYAALIMCSDIYGVPSEKMEFYYEKAVQMEIEAPTKHLIEGYMCKHRGELLKAADIFEAEKYYYEAIEIYEGMLIQKLKPIEYTELLKKLRKCRAYQSLQAMDYEKAGKEFQLLSDKEMALDCYHKIDLSEVSEKKRLDIQGRILELEGKYEEAYEHYQQNGMKTRAQEMGKVIRRKGKEIR